MKDLAGKKGLNAPRDSSVDVYSSGCRVCEVRSEQHSVPRKLRPFGRQLLDLPELSYRNFSSFFHPECGYPSSTGQAESIGEVIKKKRSGCGENNFGDNPKHFCFCSFFDLVLWRFRANKNSTLISAEPAPGIKVRVYQCKRCCHLPSITNTW